MVTDLQIKDFFKDLKFEEKEHKYYVNGSRLNLSASKIYSFFIKPFDAHKESLRMSERDQRPQKEILESWKSIANKAIKIGNAAHLFGERYALDRSLKPSNGYEEAIVSFWKDLPSHIKIVSLEAMMYHKKYMFAGTSDILLYDSLNDSYIIADYKTNKDLFKNFKSQKMLGPFSNLFCMPIEHYQIQLSIYQILIEQIPGIKVSSRKIIWIKPDGKYEMFDAKDYTHILLKQFENEKETFMLH